jgi:hypothetical protein
MMGRCAFCTIRETGIGSTGLYGNGWQVAIHKTRIVIAGTVPVDVYDLVINHDGEQIRLPIEYCPECGAKLEGEDER